MTDVIREGTRSDSTEGRGFSGSCTRLRRQGVDRWILKDPVHPLLLMCRCRWRFSDEVLLTEERHGDGCEEIAPARFPRIEFSDWGMLDVRRKSQRQERHTISCSVHGSPLASNVAQTYTSAVIF